MTLLRQTKSPETEKRMQDVTEPLLVAPEPQQQETIYSRAPSEIFVRDDRHRQLFKRKPLEELIDSIRETGQNQPGVCYTNPQGALELIIGERRLRACLLLQIPFKYYVKEEISDPLLLEQIQLDENLCREDLEWKEDLKAKARLHTVLQARFGATAPGQLGGHSFEDSATHMGVGRSIFQEDVTLAGFLEIPEVAAAPNKTTAKKIVKRLIEQVKRQELLAEALSKSTVVSVSEQAQLTEQARAEVKLIEKKQATQLSLNEEKVAKVVGDELEQGKAEQVLQLEKQLIYYSQRCFLGKMEERILSFEDESFDIVCFDPPWGVEFDAVRKTGGGTKDYDDTAEFFFIKIEEWLRLIYQKMKPNSHLYMFFGMGTAQEEEFADNTNFDEGFRYRDFIYNLLHEIGFNTNRMPLIWHKKGAHVTRNPLVWPGRSYEPIAYARKGSKPLARQGAPDVIETPMPTSSLKNIHPSAKHPQIYKELLLRSAQPTDTILDPMAGSGMFGVAAESLVKTLSLNWYQIECDEDYRNLELINLTKGFDLLTRREPTPTVASMHQDWEPEPLPASYELITPGTEKWTRYWKEHPGEQKAMLEWRAAKAESNR